MIFINWWRKCLPAVHPTNRLVQAKLLSLLLEITKYGHLAGEQPTWRAKPTHLESKARWGKEERGTALGRKRVQGGFVHRQVSSLFHLLQGGFVHCKISSTFQTAVSMGRTEQEEKVVEMENLPDQKFVRYCCWSDIWKRISFSLPVTHKVALGILQMRQPDDDWSQEERIICCRWNRPRGNGKLSKYSGKYIYSGNCETIYIGKLSAVGMGNYLRQSTVLETHFVKLSTLQGQL